MRRIVHIGLSLSLLMVAACGETLKHFHRGNKIVERHHMPGDWNVPGNTTYTECDEKQMIWSAYWSKKVCPDSIDPHATLAVDRGNIPSPNYAQLVVPSAINGAAMLGGAAMIMQGLKRAQMTQSVTGTQTQTNIPVFESPGTIVTH